jgi:hypothetical protein
MGAPITQVPFESHEAGRVRVLFTTLQVPGAQLVPGAYLRQAPFPSQAPSVLQALLPRSMQARRGSGAPLSAGVHLPGTAPSAQERQGPWQLSAQQTLSTQKVLAHSTPVWQGWPSPFLPQLRLSRMQTMPGAQSLSVAQVAWQAPVTIEQAKGAQGKGPPSRQVPRPSHRPAVTCMVALVQLGGVQTVPAMYRAHPPAPSQVPLVPQVMAGISAHWPRGSFTPAATGRHTPGEPTCPQLTQGPSHFESQQTPSTQ